MRPQEDNKKPKDMHLAVHLVLREGQPQRYRFMQKTNRIVLVPDYTIDLQMLAIHNSCLPDMNLVKITKTFALKPWKCKIFYNDVTKKTMFEKLKLPLKS